MVLVVLLVVVVVVSDMIVLYIIFINKISYYYITSKIIVFLVNTNLEKSTMFPCKKIASFRLIRAYEYLHGEDRRFKKE